MNQLYESSFMNQKTSLPKRSANDYHALRQTPTASLICALQATLDKLGNTQDDQAVKEMMDCLIQAILNGESPQRLAQRISKDRRIRFPALPRAISPDEAPRIVKATQTNRAIARQKQQIPGRRKLDPYRQAIVALYQDGNASERDIVDWLRIECQCTVSQATVHRFLKDCVPHDKKTS